MKIKLLFLVLLIFSGKLSYSQQLEKIKKCENRMIPPKLKVKEQAIGTKTGIEYSVLPVSIFYTRGFSVFNWAKVFQLEVRMTVPSMKFDFNDYKIMTRIETSILRTNTVDLSISIAPNIKGTQNTTYVATAIGAEFDLRFGYYTSKWYFGIQLALDKTFSTKLKHSDEFKRIAYSNVRDGWYKSPANSTKTGVNITRRIDKFDLFIEGGFQRPIKSVYFWLPNYYGNIGINYRFSN